MTSHSTSGLTLPLPDGQRGQPGRRSRKKTIGLILGPTLGFALGALLDATQPDLTLEASIVAGVAVLMATYWVTEALPFAVTALLPLIIFPLTAVASFGDTSAPYANSIIFLFLGGFMLAAALQRWNLHTRIALGILSKVGTKPTRIIAGLMVATAFITLWVSNSATTMMMIPVVVSVLALSAKNGALDKNFARAAVLAVAYAATIGGMGSIISATPNALVAAYLAETSGIVITFLDWMLMMMPWVVIFLVATWFLLTKVIFRIGTKEIAGGSELIAAERGKLGRMSVGEKRVAIVFAAAATSWVAFPLLAQTPLIEFVPMLGSINDSVVAIAVVVALFIVPGGQRENRSTLLRWDDTKELPWGVLILFGGGLTLSSQVGATGLGGWIGERVNGLSGLPFILILLVALFVVAIVGELMSNTAAATLFLPIMGGVAMGLGYEAAILAIPAALAANLAFMLPVGTPPNAIAFATGYVSTGDMIKAGAALNIVGMLIILGVVHTTFPLVLGM